MKNALMDIGFDYSGLTQAWSELCSVQPKKLIDLEEDNLYKVTRAVLLEVDQKYAHCKEHQQTIEVKKLLTDLLHGVLKPEQRVYLNETLRAQG